MRDENEQPLNDPEPLNYWHSTKRPISLANLALTFCAGLLFSIVAAALTFGAIASAWGSSRTGRNDVPFVPVMISIASAVAGMATLIGFVRAGRDMSVDARYRSSRYFALGFLIGVTLVALFAASVFFLG